MLLLVVTLISIIAKVQQNITSSENLVYANMLHQVIELLNVVNIWSRDTPESVQYTQREKTRFSLKQSGIFFLVSQNVEYLTKYVDSLPSIRSDQSLLFFTVSLENEHKGEYVCGIFNNNIE